MITEVDLDGTPCFAPGTKLTGLKKINFIFGPNGSGKTTLSNIFQNPSDVRLQWENNTIGTTYIFNRNFTENALASSTQLKGVFFIRRGAANTQQTIDALERQIKSEKEAYEQARKQLERATKKEIEIRENLNNAAWELKKQVDKHKLANCMKGHLGSKIAFTDRLLAITSNAGTEMTLDTLSARANQLYSDDLATIPIPTLRWEAETDPETLETLLATAITPSSESKLLPLIKRYSLFDWVTKGHEVSKEVELQGVCPYCQQEISSEIETELEALFDETYTRAKQAITDLSVKYNNDYKSLERIALTITADSESILFSEKDLNNLNTLLTKLDKINTYIIRKLEHPSQEINLPYSLADLQHQVITTLKQLKDTYEQHNKVASNLTNERLNLREDFWSWVATNKLATNIDQYNSEISKATTEAAAAQTACNFYKNAIIATQKKIDYHITQLQNSKEAMEKINSLLQDLGFTSFKLAYDAPTKGYKIIRPNAHNSICNVETLSEGEKTILTFLYLIQKVDGSSTWLAGQEPTVIIDDPIASTDAQSFFLVTQFIRRMTVYLKKPTKSSQQFKLSQLIVCTHNTRFLSEASYDCKFNNQQNNPYAHFFRLEKRSTGTTISKGTHQNHIDSEYNLLWREIKACTEEYNAHLSGGPMPDYPLLGNTMRRIIETYSTMIGKGGITKLSNHASIAVSTLVAFCNSSSHSAIDSDLHSIFTLSTSQLLDAFRQFFEEEFEEGAHFPHYCSMMNLELKDQGWSYPKITTP